MDSPSSVVLIIFTVLASSSFGHDADNLMHPSLTDVTSKITTQQYSREPSDFWRKDAQQELLRRTNTVKPIIRRAKNVILYVGDGMSVPTITAARILKGQKVLNSQFGGEETQLYMESLPYTGTSKTYCVDAQVADSACSATAYLGGLKANYGTIGLTSAVRERDCLGQNNTKNHVKSILAWAQETGKSTGIVTTTRITHASPAATYAHAAQREWENDGQITNETYDPNVCEDIAKQLITREPGKNIQVILGGGRREFLRTIDADPEYAGYTGRRLANGGPNLIELWEQMRSTGTSSPHSYVWNRDQLLNNVDISKTEYLLGLFEPSHVSYRDELMGNGDPSLEEMVEVAIRILSRNPNGFFLFVEGGRIDTAHHDNQVRRALWETVEFDKAIEKGDSMTGDEETLIVVTADHGHVMSMSGYAPRGTPIFGQSSNFAGDGLPYSTLGYGNGPGQPFIDPATQQRYDVRKNDPNDPTVAEKAAIPLYSETHGGEDVLIMAKGPFAHLFTGVHQQSYIPHAIGYAACIGNGEWSESCPERNNGTDDGTVSSGVYLTTRYSVLVSCIVIIKSQI